LFKNVTGLVGCVCGKHERSESKIHKEGDDYFSSCRFCGVRMWRRGKRDWIVERKRQQA